MRMRRKKNLEEKLSLCSNLIDVPKISRDVRLINEEKEYIDTRAFFGNDHPLRLEIGCGKGGFVCEAAKREPDVNFVAVELNKSVILMACRRALDEGIKNVMFLHAPAEILPKYFPAGCTEKIYLNFSTPFPGSPNATKRLTNGKFIEIYKYLLAKGGEVRQKTDNTGLFEYSVEQFSQHGMALKNVFLDLHRDGPDDNIVTEYEAKFAAQGLPIYALTAYLPEDGK